MWNNLNRSMMLCQMSFALSCFGIMTVLSRYFLQELEYSESDTMMVVGAYSAIGPLFAVVGGFIADKLIGAHRSLIIAYGMYALGQILLVTGSAHQSVPMTLLGIALGSYSRGLMSPTYPTLFKRAFATAEDFEKGFPVHYSVFNFGVLVGQYLFPMLILVAGFNGCFLLSAALALLSFFGHTFTTVKREQLLIHEEITALTKRQVMHFMVISLCMVSFAYFMFDNMEMGAKAVYAISIGTIFYYMYLALTVFQHDRKKMLSILIIIALTTVFFIYYGQMMTSMTIVTINTMRGDLFGFIPIAPEAAMAMNPFWCVLLGPVISSTFSALSHHGIRYSPITKVGGAFAFICVSFGILTIAMKTIDTSATLRPEVFFLVYFFKAIAEVLVGSVVVTFILSVTPKKIENLSVSLFSVAISLSGILGAVLSTSVALKAEQSITKEFVRNTYGDYFQMLTIAAIGMIVISAIANILVNKLLKQSPESQSESTLPVP
ncbi:MFS transporter [Vibrio europaeus]|uniref:MFS transporter n=1 Tax=Vibrio europaeus TaxID=300876 RepID=A0A178J522_9VIBR|nr:MFS transporter [Vibrio europaeus]MDC5706610.1 MFS transporter [Vibrio europaeus]MDC5711857.1 MFS transporter [Vibrio europaeus]MDC5716450.1 MFS transporter [Vibrio europaeus]MDC5726021.1 MFS transporter [Vibrio europaeus]MDC5733010.1 MFS transporter [Vibrio europaeus]